MTKKLSLLGIILFIIVCGTVGCVLIKSDAFHPAPTVSEGEGTSSEEIESNQEEESSAIKEQDSEQDDRFFNTNSLLIIANKKHALPEGYEPSDLRQVNVPINTNQWQMREEAASALEKMFAAAAEDGITLSACSGYRSEAYQSELYNSYVQKYSVERADAISSRPGYSDHQTGLAMDIGDHDQATVFTEAMENTPEGQWLYVHAHEYGFILRYPNGKEEITGYAYEPWHYRYVGVEPATAIYTVSPDETMEEYFKLAGGNYLE